MSNLQSALMIIMGEISIILAAILGYLAFRALRKHKSIMSAINHLTGKIRCAKNDRINMLQEFLVQHCRYDEEHAATTAQTLIEKESLFYNGLMTTYASNDTEALKDLDQRTEEVIGAYRNLVSESVKAIENEVETNIENRTQQLSSTIDELNEKNAQLNGELDQLKREMDQTVQEYSLAFRQKRSQEQAEANQQENATSQTTTADPGANIDVQPNETSAADSDLQEQGGNTSGDATDPVPTDSATSTTETPAASDTGAAAGEDQPSAQSEDDDAVEPDFETHGFDEPVTIDGPQTTDLDEEIKADLEALTALVDDDEDEGESTIPLDGLLDDEDEQQPAQERTTARR